MAYMAELDQANVVVKVRVVGDDVATEAWCRKFYKKPNATFIEAAKGGTLRHALPGKGWSYDADNDVFIGAKPHASWTLNTDFDWVAPIAVPPHADYRILWDEPNVRWLGYNENQLGKTFTWDTGLEQWVEI